MLLLHLLLLLISNQFLNIPPLIYISAKSGGMGGAPERKFLKGMLPVPRSGTATTHDVSIKLADSG